jgi:SAM-dependent methyltransferase
MKSACNIPDYGIDAPGLVRFFFLSGLTFAMLSVAAAVYLSGWRPWPALVAGGLALAAAYLLGMDCFMIYEIKVNKVCNRDRLLDLIAWRGDEVVLDVGCGRGFMLVAAALRLSTGRAVGVDIWQAQDQSSNNAEGAWENARREGIIDRVGCPDGRHDGSDRVGDYLHEDGSFVNRGNVINRSPPRARSGAKARPMATTPMRRNRRVSSRTSVR